MFMVRLHDRLMLLSMTVACCFTVAVSDSGVTYLEAHNSSVRSLAVSPNRKLAATGDNCGVVVLWKLPEMSKIATIDLKTHLPVHALSFSEDNQYVFCSGNTESPVCTIIKIAVTDLSMCEIQTAATGSILLVSSLDRDRKLIIVTAANELLVNDLSSCQGKQESHFLNVLKRKMLPGSFIRHAVLSDDRRFVAITSENEKVEQSAPPRILSIIDILGKANFSRKFGSVISYSASSICFQTNPTVLWLCAGPEGVQCLDFDPPKGEWNCRPAFLHLMPSISVSCVCPLTKTLYLASDNKILSWNMKKKSLFCVTKLEIGKGGKYFCSPIEVLACISKPTRLLAGLQDGKIAIISLGTEENDQQQENPVACVVGSALVRHKTD